MPDFGIFRGFADKLFGDKLYAGQLPTFLGLIGSVSVLIFTFKQWQLITPQTWDSITTETWN
jgi:hypothetical protein